MNLDMKEQHNKANEPELDAWTPLAAANTQLLKSFHVKPISDAVGAAPLSAVHAKLDERGEGDGNANRHGEKKTEQHRAYVDHRLRELGAFERRCRGAVKR